MSENAFYITSIMQVLDKEKGCWNEASRYKSGIDEVRFLHESGSASVATNSFKEEISNNEFDFLKKYQECNVFKPALSKEFLEQNRTAIFSRRMLVAEVERCYEHIEQLTKQLGGS